MQCCYTTTRVEAEAEEGPFSEGPKLSSDDNQEHPFQKQFLWGYGSQVMVLSPGPNLNHFGRVAALMLILEESQLHLRTILKWLNRRAMIRIGEDVIADYIWQPFLHVKEQLIVNYDLSSSDTVGHVLCVPNTWTSKACRTMQKIAEIAIQGSGLGSLNNFFIVSEAEVAATFVFHNSINSPIEVRFESLLALSYRH